QRISAASPKQPIAVPLGVLTQLVADGVPPKRAGELLTKLLRLGATPTQIADLGNTVNADVKLAGYKGLDALNARYNNLIPRLAPLSPSATTDAGLTNTAGAPGKKP